MVKDPDSSVSAKVIVKGGDPVKLKAFKAKNGIDIRCNGQVFEDFGFTVTRPDPGQRRRAASRSGSPTTQDSSEKLRVSGKVKKNGKTVSGNIKTNKFDDQQRDLRGAEAALQAEEVVAAPRQRDHDLGRRRCRRRRRPFVVRGHSGVVGRLVGRTTRRRRSSARAVSPTPRPATGFALSTIRSEALRSRISSISSASRPSSRSRLSSFSGLPLLAGRRRQRLEHLLLGDLDLLGVGDGREDGLALQARSRRRALGLLDRLLAVLPCICR